MKKVDVGLLERFFLDNFDRSGLHDALCSECDTREQVEKALAYDDLWGLWCRLTGDSIEKMTKDVMEAK